MSAINNMRGLGVIFLVIICDKQVLSKKRVCVIGAGRAGLASVKLFADQIDKFELIAFERNSDVGGLWIYRDDPEKDEHGMNAHSGIYKHLRTNLPKSSMTYPDYPDFYEKDDKENVSHEIFLEYLKNYTDHFQLRKYIQFNTFVSKVIPTKGKGDWQTTRWRMETRRLNTNATNAITCDVVMVCNGHFSKPHIPKIPGLNKTFHGRVLHSRNYRRPQDFANKTVVVLGAGDSGKDISVDLSSYAKKVYLSYRHDDITIPEKYPNLQTVRGVVAANGNKLILQDNSTIIVDAFIFCTGYEYEFPFLDNRSGISVDGKRVRPLYENFINVEHPSMAIIGLDYVVDYGRLYYWQLNYFWDLLQDKQQLPSYEDLL